MWHSASSSHSSGLACQVPQRDTCEAPWFRHLRFVTRPWAIHSTTWPYRVIPASPGESWRSMPPHHPHIAWASSLSSYFLRLVISRELSILQSGGGYQQQSAANSSTIAQFRQIFPSTQNSQPRVPTSTHHPLFSRKVIQFSQSESWPPTHDQLWPGVSTSRQCDL